MTKRPSGRFYFSHCRATAYRTFIAALTWAASTFLILPFRKPDYFLCKVRLPVARPVKDRLRLLPENLPLRHIEERISRILLDRTDRQSLGQKNNQPFDTGCIKGKNKINNSS